MRPIMTAAVLLIFAALLLLLFYSISFSLEPFVQEQGGATKSPAGGRHDPVPRASEGERVLLPAPEPANCLSGSVRAAGSGDPIAGALVYAPPETDFARMSDVPHATTDPSGRFTFCFPVRPHRLVAQAPGFVPAAILVGIDNSDIRLVLDLGLGITGRVVDRAGAGLPGVTISALGPTAAGVYRLVDRFACPAEAQPNQAGGVSDAAGGFAITSLRPGRVRLRASKVGWRPVPPPKGTFTEQEELLLRSTLPAAAGDSDVRIVMEPVWAISVRVEDQLTGRATELGRTRMAQSIGPPHPDRRWSPVGVDDADWFSGNEPNFWAFRSY